MQVFKAFLRILRKKLPIAMIWVVVFLMIAIGVTTNNSSPFPLQKINLTSVYLMKIRLLKVKHWFPIWESIITSFLLSRSRIPF